MTDWFAQIDATIAENERRDPDYYKDPDMPAAPSPVYFQPSYEDMPYRLTGPQASSNLALGFSYGEYYAATMMSLNEVRQRVQSEYYYGTARNASNSMFAASYYR